MKQQKPDDTALYRKLRGAFEMTPEQKKRVEQEIMRRAAAPKTVTVQTVQVDYADAETAERKLPGGYWFALRAIPLAACLVLVCAGAFFLHRGLKDPAEPVTQQSSLSVEEQVTLPATEQPETALTTVKMVYTDQTAGAQTVPQTVPVQQNSASAAGSRTTAVQTTVTEAVTTAQETASVTEAAEAGTTITASAAKTTTSATATTKATTAKATTTKATTTKATTTKATTTKATTTKATTTKATTTKATTTKATTTKATTTKATTTKATTTKATTTKTTTTKATTTTVTTTVTEPQPWMRAVDSPEQANIVLPDAEASPGQTVRVDVVMTEDIRVAGFQFSLMPEYVSGGVMPYFVQWNVDEIIALDMKDPVMNVLDPEEQFEFIICGAKASEILFPAGTKLFTLEVGIPEDAVPGQVFRFKEGELPIKFTGEGGDPEDVIPVRCYFGSITVI